MSILDWILRQHRCHPNQWASGDRWRCVVCKARWENRDGRWVRVDQPDS